MENDGNCAALGEYWKGKVKFDNSVYVIVGTGIGGAIIINGKLVHGKNMLAGEFGHIVVDYNNNDNAIVSTHDYGSVSGLISAVTTEKGIDYSDLSGEDIFKLASCGDVVCSKHINIFLRHLSTSIYNISYVLDPDVIVLGGAISERDDLIDSIYSNLVNFENKYGCGMTFNIQKAKFGNKANLLGALYNYLQKNRD